MHIVDGVVPAATWLGGWIVATGALAVSSRNLTVEETPRIAVLSSAFFVASAFRIPFGPTSAHLLLHGLTGVILGKRAFVAIALGVALQFLILAQGGITTIGLNACLLGLPAVLGGWLFRRIRPRVPRSRLPLLAAAVTAVTLLVSILGHAAVLLTGGSRFHAVVIAVSTSHLLVMAVECVMTGLLAGFLLRVKPELLQDGVADAP